MKRKQAATARLADPMRIYARALTIYATRLAAEFPDDPCWKHAVGILRARQWSNLIQLAESLEVQQYSSVVDHYVKTQFVALVKKFPFSPDEVPGFDPEAAAWKKFLAAEHRCKRVNQRSTALRNGDGFAYSDYLRVMRGWIIGIIGIKPDYDAIFDLCDFGPGASVGVTGDRTNLGRKLLQEKWTVTRLALSLATRALWQHEQIRLLILGGPIACLDYEVFSQKVQARVGLVSHNNISFVPKTFKTHRSIASEPLLNGFLQKGIDVYLRQRLKNRSSIDLDLRDQSVNSEMARIGSIDGGENPYCTIDLSSASDSLPTSIVKNLLPAEWFDLLDRTRSHLYRYKGKVYPYSKFVSMGNGFCFPLQTLVFASVCYAVGVVHGRPVDFRVYGDDIIVRRDQAALVLEILRHLGFRHNPDKTFLFGPFRESCGTDWYSGQDVRPVYLDYRLSITTDLYKFHNSTLRGDLPQHFFSEVREYLREVCPPKYRLCRPYHGNADGCFTVPKDVAMSCDTVVWDRSRWAWRWKEVVSTPTRDRLDGLDPVLCNSVEYLAVLRGSSSRVPLAVRRKTRASVRTKSYWGLPGEIPWRDADPIRLVRGL